MSNTHLLEVRTSRDSFNVAIIEDGARYVTNPNASDHIPEPARDAIGVVTLKQNGKYGADDPILWPQCYCDDFPFFPFIPRLVWEYQHGDEKHSFAIMFQDLADDMIQYDQNTMMGGLGVLRPEFVLALTQSFKVLDNRLKGELCVVTSIAGAIFLPGLEA